MTQQPLPEAAGAMDDAGILRQFLASSPQFGTWAHDEKTGRLSLSDSARAFLKTPPGAPPALQTVLDLLEPDFASLVREGVKRAHDSGDSFEAEGAAALPSGETKWIRWMGGKIGIGGETAVGGLVEDISGRGAREQEAGTRLRHMSAMVETSQMGLFDADLMLDSVKWDLRHLPDAESIGDPGSSFSKLPELMHEEDRRRYTVMMNELLAYDIPVSMDCRIRDADSDWRWFQISAGIVQRDQDGRAARVMGSISDIGERRRLMSDLVEAESNLRAILRNAGIGIAVIDAKGRIERQNPAFSGIFSLDGETETPRSLFSLIPHPDRESAEFSIAAVFSQNTALRMESRCLCADGRIIWAQITCSPIARMEAPPERAVVLLENVTERKNMVERLQYDVMHDSMTGLLNHKTIMERLRQDVALAIRHGAPLVLCVCDIDHFKMVNDRYGHQTGDHVLRTFASILRNEVRVEDSAGRYGGEEFALVLPQTGLDGAVSCVNRIRGRLASTPFGDRSGKNAAFPVTATFGLAELREGMKVEELVKAADMAMYQGKAAGRNAVVRWNGETGPAV